jgi:hypothetical protein
MISGKDTVTVPDNRSFETVLDDICDRLWDRKVRYSIRRLQEMDAVLAVLERELNELIHRGETRSMASGGGALQDRPG